MIISRSRVVIIDDIISYITLGIPFHLPADLIANPHGSVDEMIEVILNRSNNQLTSVSTMIGMKQTTGQR
jgi:hypothetical protein